jgi:hypothetical protein
LADDQNHKAINRAATILSLSAKFIWRRKEIFALSENLMTPFENHANR